ncbi:MAG: hypothetical protein QHH15_05445 [Candidatus Thermoplasmatota archaeon]|nr:hypothetical protein [Candidatus Thermoplasmatota archaeon]
MIPIWNSNWAYRQEIEIPILTEDNHSRYQPIDIHIDFKDLCWAKNEIERSIRIVCWDGKNWHELESQIYDLEYYDKEFIKGCRIIFLIPEFAYGKERYFIYYDKNPKPSPNYVNHVNVEDAYYYFEPISGLSAEGDYYKITEDGYCVYGVGQKGCVFERNLAQTIIRMKPGSKEFDVVNSDTIVSFGFIYSIGPDDKDHFSSDQVLLSKKININGNLMVEFEIVSQSNGKELQTSNIYRYYYCPVNDKRIFVHVKHEVFQDCYVEGQVNIDGIYGSLLSFRSKNSRIKKLQFGEIYPYLHIYDKNNQIKKYKLNTNPESKEREWVIPYSDDCDLGENAWISYGEGDVGRANGILFPSNTGIVKSGKDERDGIQVKAGEKEYFNALGTEIDYAGVIFGRNSYEKGSTHDLIINKGLVVEFDVEVYTTEDKGCNGIIKESEYFRILSKYRNIGDSGLPGKNSGIYTLTAKLRFCGRILLYPIFSNLSEITCEIYRDNELVSRGLLHKPLFGLPTVKFTKLSYGDYIVKIYRKFINQNKKIIAIEPVNIDGDKEIYITCSWQKNIKITVKNQENKRVENTILNIYKNDKIIINYVTEKDSDTQVFIPFSRENYKLKAYYKGFLVYDEIIPKKAKNVEISLQLYDLKVNVFDLLGFSPVVEIRPIITSSTMDNPTDIFPNENKSGNFIFNNLPPATYKLYISYGRFYDYLDVKIPNNLDSVNLNFSAIFDLNIKLFDLNGNFIQDDKLKLDVKRNENTIFKSVSINKNISLPPGKYSFYVYSDKNVVGIKTLEITNDKDVNIVTNLKPTIYIIITTITIMFVLEIMILCIIKKISLNSFLKLLALSLVIISIFQPWWSLTGISNDKRVTKTTDLFIITQTMIESINFQGQTFRDIANLPDIFTSFISILLIIIISGMILLGCSFILNIFLKKRFFLYYIS